MAFLACHIAAGLAAHHCNLHTVEEVAESIHKAAEEVAAAGIHNRLEEVRSSEVAVVVLHILHGIQSQDNQTL